MLKNVAGQKLQIFAFDATTGLPKTGDAANLTAYVSKDSGAVTVLTDTTATEEDATNAKGWYLFDLTQAETNGDILRFSGKSTTANVVVVGYLAYTRPANYTALSIDVSGRVDAGKMSGVTLTGRDIGASVLISPGTGTGQLDVTSGVLKSNLSQILGTALTETAGQIAAAFKQFFDVATPTGTMKAITAVGTVTGNVNGNVGGNVTGSVGSIASGGIVSASFAANAIGTGAVATALDTRIADAVWNTSRTGHTGAGTFGLYLDAQVSTVGGSPPTLSQIVNGVWDEPRASHVTAGTFGEGAASVQGNVTGSVGSVTGAVGSVTGNVGGNVGGSVGSIATGGISSASFAANSITSSALATSAADEVAASVWGAVRASYTAAGTFGEGVASVQGNVTGSVGSLGATAQSNVLTQVNAGLASYDAPTKAEMDAAFAALNDLSFADVWTGVLTESYAADGAQMTAAQALYAVVQFNHDRDIVGTTETIYKRDGTVVAMQNTLNDATNPTSVRRTL